MHWTASWLAPIPDVSSHTANLGLGKNPKEYDLHLQLVNLMQSKEGSETGVAFVVDMVGALLDKLQIIFYSAPINAAFRALGVD